MIGGSCLFTTQGSSCEVLLQQTLALIASMSLLIRVGGLLLVISVAIALFLGIGSLLKMEEITGVLAMLKSRLNRAETK